MGLCACAVPRPDRPGSIVVPAQSLIIANCEVRLPVMGYAVDPESDALVYLNLVGHKTAARKERNATAEVMNFGGGTWNWKHLLRFPLTIQIC